MKSELSIECVPSPIDGSDSQKVVLRLRGDVNLQTSAQLLLALSPLLTDAMQSISVDLSEVAMMDSSGIATLVEGLRWSQRSGGAFVLTGMSDWVRDAFGLARLQQAFTIV